MHDRQKFFGHLGIAALDYRQMGVAALAECRIGRGRVGDDYRSRLNSGLDMATVAAWFCELDDEKQADFFIEVAKRAEDWATRPETQWLRVGGHLRTCTCATDEARELIRSLHYGLENGG